MAKKVIYDIEDVFGISRVLPINYVSRNGVDDIFEKSLKRKRHIILHGSSKQGKTSLRKKHINEDSCIVVQCKNGFSYTNIFESILKLSGFEINETSKNGGKGSAKFTASFSLPGILSTGIEAGGESNTEKNKKGLTFDISNENDVINALNSINFNKKIVIEDFHYLDEAEQQGFAGSLKAFDENTELVFVIIGVWLDRHKLLHYNGDLFGRIENIDVDKWTTAQLEEVITTGEKLLNIKFHKSFSDILIQNAYGCISLVMELCYRYCEKSNITCTQQQLIKLDREVDFYELIEDIVDLRGKRFNTLLQKIGQNISEDAKSIISIAIITVFVSPPENLENGISVVDIIEMHKKLIQEKALTKRDIIDVLCTFKSFQVTNKIYPVILEYNESSESFHIIDKYFFLWNAHKSIFDLLQYWGADENINARVKLLLKNR